METFEEFVARESPALRRVARSLTGDASLADDLLNETLARVWPHWSRVAAGTPTAYARIVMTNLQRSWWRRKWRGEVPTSDMPERASVDDDGAERDRLRRALMHLPLPMRQAVVLRYVDDLSTRDVAQILDRSEGTVKSQCARGLAHLREVLGQEGDDDE